MSVIEKSSVILGIPITRETFFKVVGVRTRCPDPNQEHEQQEGGPGPYCSLCGRRFASVSQEVPDHWFERLAQESKLSATDYWDSLRDVDIEGYDRRISWSESQKRLGIFDVGKRGVITTHNKQSLVLGYQILWQDGLSYGRDEVTQIMEPNDVAGHQGRLAKVADQLHIAAVTKLFLSIDVDS